MSDTGYFTIEQMDRANLKTMANPLPDPWTGSHLLALLVVLSDIGIIKDLSPKESKQAVIEWYCTTRTPEIVEALELYSKWDEFKTVMEIQRLVHTNPEGLKEALDAIEQGWRPNQ